MSHQESVGVYGLTVGVVKAEIDPFRFKCDDAPDEEIAEPLVEDTLKVECHISNQTNFMQRGIKEVGRTALECLHSVVDRDRQDLDQKVTKNSPSLQRDATYSQTSRLDRLPTYLTVHMVRFAWKADISKKVKIMVRGPHPTGEHKINFSGFSSGKSSSRRNTMR